MDDNVIGVPGEGEMTLEVTLTLNRQDVESLTLLLGMAMGCATQETMTKLGWTAVRLANELHKGDPHWHPYSVPKEFQ